MSNPNPLFSLIVVEENQESVEFDLTEKVTLLGRRVNNVILSHPSVSGRHASLERDGDGFVVKDLGSKNGTFINGKRIGEGRLEPGDTLGIGKVKLILECGDPTVTSVETVAPSAPSAPSAPFSPSPQPSGNGECGTTLFDDGGFCPVDGGGRTLRWNREERDYIDFEDDDFIERKPEDIVEKRPDGDSLEVTTFVSGNIMARDYFPLKNGFFYTGRGRPDSGVVDLPGFYDDRPRPLMEVKGGVPWLLKVPNFKCRSLTGGVSEEGKRWKLEKGDTLSLESGVTQLMVRHGKMPPILKNRSMLKFDSEDVVRVGLTVWLVLVMVVSALIFDTRIKEVEKKTVSVIYRPKPILRVKPKPKPVPVTRAESPKKAGKKSPVQRTQKKIARKRPVREAAKQKPRKVAKSDARPTPSKKPAPKTKTVVKTTYTMSNKNQLKNLFKSLSTSGTPRVVKDNSSVSAKSLSTVREVSGAKGGLSESAAKSLGKIGGGGLDGRYDLSTGSRGLSSKKGVSKVSYSVEAAVVSGGIDAELLSKILRELIPQFQHCYQRELVRNRNLEGVVDLYFRITPEGRASDIRVVGKRFSFGADGEACMKKIFNLVRLPRPPGGGVVDVKQALNFSSLNKN